MKTFICNRSIDTASTTELIQHLLHQSENQIAVLLENPHTADWKKSVEKKMQEADFILFVLGERTFESDNLKWEYAKAKSLNKQIIGIKLPTASEESVLFCQGFQVFEQSAHCIKFLQKTYEDNRKLLLEQYKMMVSSTEKVTDSRLKVNNLFFTVTSSLLSVAFIVGKTFHFNGGSLFAMLLLTLIALLVSFFWEKLVNSYGNLNKGKFIIIHEIEQQLRTNMFEHEWKVLTEQIEYIPNTKTETNIIKYFRVTIIILGICESLYLFFSSLPLSPVC